MDCKVPCAERKALLTTRNEFNSSEDKCNLEFWIEIKPYIDEIYARKEMTISRYMHIYTSVYNFCITRKIYSSPALRILQLYDKLQEFFLAYSNDLLKKCDGLINESLLQWYETVWEDYCASSKCLDHVFSYVNRYWVLRQRKKGNFNVLEIYHLAIASWKSFLFEPLQCRISSAARKLIEKERRGETIKVGLIKSALDSSIKIQINRMNPYSEHEDLLLYKTAFEREFLADSEVFYSTESASITRESSVAEFMKKIEMWYQEEIKRTLIYIHISTLEASLNTIRTFVIEKYIDTLQSEFLKLLACNKMDDLRRMFQLLCQVTYGLDKLQTEFENYVREQGLAAIEECNKTDCPRTYIKTILDIYQRNCSIVVSAFENSILFRSALDKAFFVIMNNNAVTLSNGSSKSAEFLAKYCNLLLKKKRRNAAEETEVADSLKQAMELFQYIMEKDVFEKFYYILLAKRLVQQMFSSLDDYAEEYMLSTLQKVCHFEYISKLRKLFQDVAISKDLNNLFHATTPDCMPGVDLSINVIRSSSWPMRRPDELNLPHELEKSVQCFTTFYWNQYEGRRLSWLHALSSGELISTCFSKPYTFQASLFQMAILLQFNTGDTFTISQLEESSGIQSNVLKQVLQVLAKMKLLKLQDESLLNPSSTVSLCLEYRSKKLKININAPVKSQIKSEEDTTHKHVRENRKLLIQATIVRIAKARKTFTLDQLFCEILTQLKERFKPDMSVIRTCVEILVEKEYLKRENSNTYMYVA